MSTLLLAALVVLGSDPQRQLGPATDQQGQPAAHQGQQPGIHPGQFPAMGGMVNVNVEGSWTVVCFERHGQPAHVSGNVTIRNNTLTLNEGGREHGWHLTFGPNNTLTATPIVGNQPGSTTGIHRGGFGSNVGQGSQAPGRANAGAANAQETEQERQQPSQAQPGAVGRPQFGQGVRHQAMSTPRQGVYIVSREYLCLCLRGPSWTPGIGAAFRRPGQPGAVPAAGAPGTAVNQGRPGLPGQESAAVGEGGQRTGAGHVPGHPPTGTGGSGSHGTQGLVLILHRG